MPELPEVLHHSEKLKESYQDTILESIIIHRGPYLTSEKEKYSKFRELSLKYQPCKVKDVKTKGKYMYFLLEEENHIDDTKKSTKKSGTLLNTDVALCIHHGMEGSWCTDSENKHIILELRFSKNKSVFFQDSRRFGTFALLSKDELEDKLTALGPDVFHELKNYSEFSSLITSKFQKKRLCEVLMDQSFISGIGNYLRADIMYHAKLDPQRLMNSFSEEELEKLYDSIKFIVKSSYDSGATTTGNYKSSVHSGSYKFLIYGKNTCPLGNSVENFKDKQKRTVHWVPDVQC